MRWILPVFACPTILRRQCCCLVSKRQDGSYLADAMSWLQYKAVRGSSQRGGAEAIRQLMTDTAGRHIVITPDGPRGPRRQMKVGPLFLAAQLGRGILPSAYVFKRGWRIRGSWTDMALPMPFTTVYLVVGDPIPIRPDLSRAELEIEMAKVQRAMDQINDETERIYAGQPAAPFIPRKKAA